MSSIFGRTHKNCVLQFRAGKMTRSGKTVTPDPRKGVVSVIQKTSGTVEIQWEAEGDSASLETRIIVGNVTVNRVTKCTTGRVFVIDFGGDQQLFFWLQERSEERDGEYLALLKKLLERRAQPAPVARASQPEQRIPLSTLEEVLQQMRRGPGSSTALPEPASTSARNTIDFQRVLLSSELLAALREDPAFYMTKLFEHLPPGTDASSDIVEQLRNPQITAAAAHLQLALSDPDGFRELCAAFSIPTNGDIPSTGPLEFLEAICRSGAHPS